MTHHILIVSRWYPSYDRPGSGSFVADQVAALQRAGARTTVASFDYVRDATMRGDVDRIRSVESAWTETVRLESALTIPRTWGAGAPVARLPVVKTWIGQTDQDTEELVSRHTGVLQAFGSAYAARAAAAGDPVTVVHAHTGIPDGLAAVPLAKALAVPLVVTEHDLTLPRRLADPTARMAYRELLGASRVVAVSRALADRIAGALVIDGPAVAPIELIPNPVPLEPFRDPNGGQRDLDEALWVGARAEHKGMETLLRAMRIAIGACPGLRLRLIGPAAAPDDARWEALAAELGISERVSFEPQADRAGVALAMHRAGLFVHPSPWETFGIVAAEALASGLPVAATRSGGVDEIIGPDPRYGELATEPGPDGLAAAIVRLRERLPSIPRETLAESVAARYAPEVVAARTLELYARIGVAARRSSGSGTLYPAAVSNLDRPSGPRIAALVVARRAATDQRVAALPRESPVRSIIVGGPATSLPPEGPHVVDPWLLVRGRGLIGRVRRILGRPPVASIAPRRAAELRSIRSAWAQLGGRGRIIPRFPWRPALWVVVVPADADDLESARAALGERALKKLAPGSLRWLADRQDATTATWEDARDAVRSD